MVLQYAKAQTLFSYSWKGPRYKMRYFWHQDNSCNVTAAASWWYLMGATSEGALLAIMRKRRQEGLLDKILCSNNMVKAALFDASQFSDLLWLIILLKEFAGSYSFIFWRYLT